MEQRIRFIEKTYDALVITEDTSSEIVDIAGAYSLAYVVDSGADSPFSSHTLQLEGSLDQETWIDIGSATNVSAAGVNVITSTSIVYRYYRLTYGISSGSASVTTSILVIK